MIVFKRHEYNLTADELKELLCQSLGFTPEPEDEVMLVCMTNSGCSLVISRKENEILEVE